MKKLFVLAALAACFAVSLPARAQTSSCLPVAAASAHPWQFALQCTFTSGSTPAAGYSVSSLVYWQIYSVPSGTVASATLSLDSAAGPSTSYSTGGILSSGTIGSLLSTPNYSNSSATTPTSYMQITPTIVGTGAVTVTIYGYVNPPSGGGGSIASNVNVINNPAITGNVNQTLGNAGYAKVVGNAGASLDGAPGATAPVNGVQVGGAYNSTAPSPSNGQFEPFQLDPIGDLNVAGGSAAESTAAWTSATSLNTALQVNLGKMTSVNVFLNQGSTISGGVVTFEGSDTTAFTNAYPVLCVSGNANATGTTYTLSQATNQEYDCDVSSYAAFRVRLSTVISGTGTVNLGIIPSAFPAVPDVAVAGSVNISGTPIGVTCSSGTACPVNVANNQTTTGNQSLTSSSSSTCTGSSGGNGVILSVPGAGSLAFQIAINGATNSTTLGFYENLDGANWVAAPSGTVTPYGGGAPVTGGANGATSGTVLQYEATLPAGANFQVCGPTSAGVTATIDVNASAAPRNVVKLSGNQGQQLDATVGSGTAPANTVNLNQYNTTAPAPANAQTQIAQGDQAANALMFPGVQFKTGAAWNSSTSVNTVQFPTGTTSIGQISGAPAYLVQLDQNTTLTGGVVTFKGSYDGGQNYVTIPTPQVLSPQTCAQLTNPYTVVASTNQPFLILAQGFTNIEAVLTTAISGTGSVTPYWQTLSNPGACATAQIYAGNLMLASIAGPSSNNNLLVIPTPASGSTGANALTVQTVVTLTSGTAGVNVKATTGNFYGAYVYNANASVCYLELINSASGGTLGTEVFDWEIPPSTGMFLPMPGGFSYNLSSGIAVGADTSKAGAAACGSAMNVTVFYR